MPKKKINEFPSIVIIYSVESIYNFMKKIDGMYIQSFWHSANVVQILLTNSHLDHVQAVHFYQTDSPLHVCSDIIDFSSRKMMKHDNMVNSLDRTEKFT